MSSAAPRSGERMIHQDFIARIRYSNALPPPPNPPKLLDIPNTGLASGQYTTPGFASRLAREQPLNIEADAELGMPLDLVGMPGVFDGDESSIQAPVHPPAVHPHDRALLRPIAALGKLKVAESNVSFLRRTEYISSVAPKRIEAVDPHKVTAKLKRPARKHDQSADSPLAMKRKIDRGFEVAEQELKDPKRLKHPTNRNAKVVDASPLVPDLDAFPDSGAYVTIKFSGNPVPSSSEYDTRLLSGFFRPIDRTEAEEAAYEAALEAHEQDPRDNPKPQNQMNYDYYLGQSTAAGNRFRSRFDVDNADHDDDDLYTHQTEGGACFQFNRVRAYETYKETELDQARKYQDEVILAFNDDDAFPRQKAVYYYPVMQKSTIRPQRNKNIARTIGLSQDEEEQIVDQLDVTVEEPTEEMRETMARYKEQPLGFEDEPQEEELVEAPEEEPERELREDMDGESQEAQRNGNSPDARRGRSASEEHDATGDEED